MKNWAMIVLGVVPFWMTAQVEEPIEYFTDDKVQDTRFSVAAVYAPSYAFRRLAFYEPTTDGSELFSLLSEDGGGIYGQRYGIMTYYELSPLFHVGVGFTQEESGFITKDFAVFDQNAIILDTLGVFNAKTSYSAIAVPLQIVFHTQMTDIWALQVVPSYDLIFMQKIDRQWVGENVPTYSADAATGVLGTMYERGTNTRYAQGFNGTIGFALSNEFTVANNLSLMVRGEFRLGLLPVNTTDVGLREVPYGVGGLVGFRYYL